MAEPTPADPDANFNEAFEREWVAVFRFALAWTNDWSVAEDLAQEAFTRLWAKRSQIDWSIPILPWLLTTTRRLATDRFRRLTRSIFASGRSDVASLDADTRLRWLDVRDAMSSLTPFQRTALVMTAVVGLNTDAVAAALDTTPGGVRAAVSRAREALRRSDG